MNLEQLNKSDAKQLALEFEKCCGSQSWVLAMLQSRPFPSRETLHELAQQNWSKLTQDDILEAFSHHPQIGDVASLKKKFSNTAHWAGKEQGGTAEASDDVLQQLKQANAQYLDKFGYIFIVCATGKSASEMLQILQSRLKNDKQAELKIAAQEQIKITQLRLEKLLKEKTNAMSPITTHVLDTAKGQPAANIKVRLEFLQNNNWITVAKGTTDNDGRIMNWMDKEAEKGEYRISFHTAQYHENTGFFPVVTINFTIEKPSEHYHVPLLLSPFAYSTYRGS